jgi:hypothetical protein
MEEKEISIEDAYKAMFYYIENLYELTKSSDLGGFLGAMVLLDGKPMDSAVWEDWIDAIKKVENDKKNKL